MNVNIVRRLVAGAVMASVRVTVSYTSKGMLQHLLQQVMCKMAKCETSRLQGATEQLAQRLDCRGSTDMQMRRVTEAF